MDEISQNCHLLDGHNDIRAGKNHILVFRDFRGPQLDQLIKNKEV